MSQVFVALILFLCIKQLFLMFTIFIFCWFWGSNFLVICYIGCKMLYRKQDYRLISDLLVINYSSLLQHSSISFPTPLRYYCLVNYQLRNIIFPETIFQLYIYICWYVCCCPKVSQTLYMASILLLYSFWISPKLRLHAWATRAHIILFITYQV